MHALAYPRLVVQLSALGRFGELKSFLHAVRFVVPTCVRTLLKHTNMCAAAAVSYLAKIARTEHTPEIAPVFAIVPALRLCMLAPERYSPEKSKVYR